MVVLVTAALGLAVPGWEAVVKAEMAKGEVDWAGWAKAAPEMEVQGMVERDSEGLVRGGPGLEVVGWEDWEKAVKVTAGDSEEVEMVGPGWVEPG